ncbi:MULTISPECIES: acyl-CoA dehydrogenase family protein [Mycobacteriaceae]|uniref:Acyl-CoA/acyl-ACP dehydrogenase n=1 Tax=Mycolicibacterium parafortuitum TaxID=39692 RepID=A0ACC6MJQ1_MYCPF|nr:MULTISPECIES: acyl-CoA dehydrogenase family protein [Mycobacteriaceae]MDZ5087158.1 acyl-CoA/acyl-ACP dehydrogenase [Mycolicibacterium parafortuitum]GFM22261.1 acyl-CoA dehydrogenase domain-containing protein [Mycobacterium sp. PO2]
MADDFTEFHDELRAVAGDLLAKDREPGWQELVDAGWVGIEVPEDLGGAGASFAETAILLDQIGRAAGATGYLGNGVLTVGALAATTGPDAEALLGRVTRGELRMALAFGEFALDGSRLSGHAEFVPDAVGADHLLVVTGSATGTCLAVVPSGGLTVAGQPVLDETRHLATVTADAAPVDTVLDLSNDRGVAALLDRAAVAIACDSVGVAEQMLTATVDYVRVRHQFGRPIGSFQAVKHACADMLVDIEVSRRLVADAVDLVAAGGDTEIAAAMAKAHATSTAVAVAGKAMQLHGGIGYTWESGIHAYLKRAVLNRSLFGSPAAHRKKLAQRYSTR